MQTNIVVARLIDGQTIKGTTLNVDPERPTFHVRTDAGPIEVRLVDLKALFFVKNPVGNPRHQEAFASAVAAARAPPTHRRRVDRNGLENPRVFP